MPKVTECPAANSDWTSGNCRFNTKTPAAALHGIVSALQLRLYLRIGPFLF